jgi:formamidopyrimidine-DNA glycosylase
MPELPEVETVMRGLCHLIQPPGVIKEVRVSKKALRFPYPKNFAKCLQGFSIQAIERRSKYLSFVGESKVLLSHLGMTGNWRQSDSLDVQAHDHLLLRFEGGLSLVYNDVRRFGFFDLVKRSQLSECKWFAHLGPEPLPVEELQVDQVVKALKRRKSAIKVAVMDAKVLVGVGNIYASEALYRSGIRPHRRADQVSEARLHKLIECIQEVLQEAIDSGGSTIRDFKNSGGSSGYFQTRLQVYGKAGECCENCGGEIRSQMLNGRNTFWCSNCQR